MASPTESPSWEREKPCPCRGCTVSRKQTRKIILKSVQEIHQEIKCCTDESKLCDVFICSHCKIEYPCKTIRIIQKHIDLDA